MFQDKWQNLAELMEFDAINGIPSTFFIGMENGLGLNYSQKSARHWSNLILSKGFDIGVHGIAYNNAEKMFNEYQDFRKNTGLDNFGIRMHYLRKDNNTHELISKTGYLFDSGIYSIESPFKMNNLWEFPVHIMDTFEFQSGKPWQNRNLEQAKKSTLIKIETVMERNLPYLNVLMHDFYFSDGFASWKQWYIWLVEYLRGQGFGFVDFKTAIKEMENKKL